MSERFANPLGEKGDCDDTDATNPDLPANPAPWITDSVGFYDKGIKWPGNPADPDADVQEIGPFSQWSGGLTTQEELGGVNCLRPENVLAPGFAGPPLHIHPTAEESYAVVSGMLDVCVGDKWRKLAAGESVTVPPGTPHTLRNESGAEVRLVNVHRPALQFERFFRRRQGLGSSGRVTLPPKGLQSAILLSMLFTEHHQEIVSVKPSRRSMQVLSALRRMFGYELPL